MTETIAAGQTRWTASKAEFVWHGEHPDVEAIVRAELIEELTDLRRAEDLVFHDAWLEGDPHGAAVLVWGVQGDTRLHCSYRARNPHPTAVSSRHSDTPADTQTPGSLSAGNLSQVQP